MSDYIMPDYGGGSPSPPERGWRIIGRHKNIIRARITESIAEDAVGRQWRRFTATVHGFQRFRLVAGVTFDPAIDSVWGVRRQGQNVAERAFNIAKAIRDDIDRNGEDAVSFDVTGFTKWHVLPYEGWKEN